jgi:hypothetical protein
MYRLLSLIIAFVAAVASGTAATTTITTTTSITTTTKTTTNTTTAAAAAGGGGIIVIIIFIIASIIIKQQQQQIIHFPYVTAVSLVLKRVPSHRPSTSYSLSCQNLLTIWHVLSITAFCIRIYTAGQSLSGFKFSCNLFEVIPVEDSTNGII